MSPLEILRASRDLISDPARWCSGCLAKDADGREVSSLSPYACRWCALGAVNKAAGGNWWMDKAVNALSDECHSVHGINVSRTNDEMGREVVLGCFDAAIRKLEPPAAGNEEQR